MIESTIYKVFYANKIPFPRFLYAYTSFLITLIPAWTIIISLIFLDINVLNIIPITLGLLIFIWPLLSAEYALYIFAEKFSSYHKIKETEINQKARAPWVAMKDLW